MLKLNNCAILYIIKSANLLDYDFHGITSKTENKNNKKTIH